MRFANLALPASASVFCLLTGIAVADVPINGITIGAPVSTTAQTLGSPLDVISADSGNGFLFAGGTTAYVDDDGVVLAVDLRSGSPRISIDGTPRVFPIGVYSAANADAELANVAEFTTETLRSYRLAPRRDLVFAFAASSQLLQRVTYGEPGQLARLGLLPGDAAAKAVVYRAPKLRRPPGAAAAVTAGRLTSIFRITIGRDGAVSRVDDILTSAQPAGDDDLARRLRSDRYSPATLDGRPIAAAIFVELRH